jgi:hypothetical protein
LEKHEAGRLRSARIAVGPERPIGGVLNGNPDYLQPRKAFRNQTSNLEAVFLGCKLVIVYTLASVFGVCLVNFRVRFQNDKLV